jgi:PAS domain S-box-containing protein
MKIKKKLIFVFIFVFLPLIAEGDLFSNISFINVLTKKVFYQFVLIDGFKALNGAIVASADMLMTGTEIFNTAYSAASKLGNYVTLIIVVIILAILLIVFLFYRSNHISSKILKSSEEKYRLIFDAAANIIILIDKKAVVVDCNIQIQKMLGYMPDKIINRSIEDIIHLDYQKQMRNCMEETLTSDDSKTIECKMIHKDGKPVNVRINSSRVKDKNEQTIGAICIVENTMERKRLEEQLRMSQKMEAVGRLAGGIAHDFNNMLTAIIGYSEIALVSRKRDGSISNYLNEIKKAGEKAASLTQQLLAFSRKQVLQPKVLLINKLI